MKCGEIVMKFIKSSNSGGVEHEKFIFNSSRVGSIRQNHRSHRISYGVIYVQSLRDFLNWELLHNNLAMKQSKYQAKVTYDNNLKYRAFHTTPT